AAGARSPRRRPRRAALGPGARGSDAVRRADAPGGGCPAVSAPARAGAGTGTDPPDARRRRPTTRRGSGMKPVRGGILSTAAIGTRKVIPGMLKSREFEVAAIASRDADRAREAATELGIAKSYGSYEALLADPTIDAVYNPLPNHLHVPWSEAAARAG